VSGERKMKNEKGKMKKKFTVQGLKLFKSYRLQDASCRLDE